VCPRSDSNAQLRGSKPRPSASWGTRARQIRNPKSEMRIRSCPWQDSNLHCRGSRPRLSAWLEYRGPLFDALRAIRTLTEEGLSLLPLPIGSPGLVLCVRRVDSNHRSPGYEPDALTAWPRRIEMPVFRVPCSVSVFSFQTGSGGGARTRALPLNRRALCQLSYPGTAA
jgi:hypothetical protein